jgi:maleylacetoacetate isomerase
MTPTLYGFWRSLATYRVRVALALKGVAAREVPIDLLKGEQLSEEYRKLNPQGVVPALVIDEGPPLFQSMAILEYLEETYPQPGLLPADGRGRARVRGLTQIAVADGHPIITPRVRSYLESELRLDEAARTRWCAHWMGEALKALEGHLARDRDTGKFCHGDTPTLADIGLASQVVGAKNYFGWDTGVVPTVMRVFGECMKLEAFERALPLHQPGAPHVASH